jgi:DNA-binding MarR family transcriptional regulator
MPNETDPKGLRALAHPLRWKLLDLLGSEGSATATRCAQVLGESVPSCAYHLGMLAKYGYVEQVPDREGREKPFRLTSYQQQLKPDGDDLASQLAGEATVDVFLDHELARTKSRQRSGSAEPAGWRPVIEGTTNWLTQAEFEAVIQHMRSLVEQNLERLTDVSARPEGAREVRLFFTASVAPETGG